MDRLPLEILNRIFIQLPFNQKKECMLVCRLWEDAIKNHCLFHTLEISDEDRYREFMGIMKQTPSFRKQVVDLAVLVYWGFQDISNLIEYFQNLTHFSFTRRDSEERYYIDSETTGSDCRMRYIQDADSCTLLRALLEAGLCSRLKEIHVDCFDPDQLIPVLKDMPDLKRVSLGHSYITIAQLEMLHENLPSIDSLAVDLAPFNGLVPTNITPAVSVTLIFVQMEYIFEEDQISWLLYASKKYPNLKEYYIEIETRGYEQEDMEELKNIYSVGYTPFLERLGPQLTSIHLPGAQFDNFKIFQKMDNHGCQIKNIVLFSDHDNTWRPALSQSNQARHITNFSIYDVINCPFDWLERLEVLESLTIDFDGADDIESRDKIDISMLLNSCSKTVKSINLIRGNYCFGNFDGLFQIEEMRLDYGRVPANIDQFIINCLPNLRVLSLNGSIDSNLILPKHHFSYVRLYLHESVKHSNFSVTTKKDNKRYLFTTENKKSQVYMSFYDKYIKPIDEDEFNGEPFIDLVFSSVRKLVINDYEALLY